MKQSCRHIILAVACAGLVAGCGTSTEPPAPTVAPTVKADPKADIITLPAIKGGKATGQMPRQKVTPITLPPIKS